MTGGRVGQSGQALVGALIALVLVFAMAGALTSAASALLAEQRLPGSTFVNDIAVQNAVDAAVAQVIGSTGRCSPAESLTSALPANPDAFTSVAACRRVDNVDLGGQSAHILARQALNISGRGCQPVLLQGSGAHPVTWFEARWSAGSGPVSVALANNALCRPGDIDDSPCPQFGSSEVTPGLSQVSATCDLTSHAGLPVYLWVQNQGSVVIAATVNIRFTDYVPSPSGVSYMLAAQGTAAQWDAADLFVSQDNNTRVLRYEAAL